MATALGARLAEDNFTLPFLKGLGVFTDELLENYQTFARPPT